ncbi:hypothetical protein AC579_6478 [Pseudocercospora musae]|uniref:Uncharacterized protein n=1 Tax=Pseudocercospora musae TaxID=113226 RepID=A0A139IJZ4_9PEZI|nr:hypothetical protein AC579_6478 [Pseudocercospora musae]
MGSDDIKEKDGKERAAGKVEEDRSEDGAQESNEQQNSDEGARTPREDRHAFWGGHLGKESGCSEMGLKRLVERHNLILLLLTLWKQELRNNGV